MSCEVSSSIWNSCRVAAGCIGKGTMMTYCPKCGVYKAYYRGVPTYLYCQNCGLKMILVGSRLMYPSLLQATRICNGAQSCSIETFDAILSNIIADCRFEAFPGHDSLIARLRTVSQLSWVQKQQVGLTEMAECLNALAERLTRTTPALR